MASAVHKLLLRAPPAALALGLLCLVLPAALFSLPLACRPYRIQELSLLAGAAPPRQVQLAAFLPVTLVCGLYICGMHSRCLASRFLPWHLFLSLLFNSNTAPLRHVFDYRQRISAVASLRPSWDSLRTHNNSRDRPLLRPQATVRMLPPGRRGPTRRTGRCSMPRPQRGTAQAVTVRSTR